MFGTFNRHLGWLLPAILSMPGWLLSLTSPPAVLQVFSRIKVAQIQTSADERQLTYICYS